MRILQLVKWLPARPNSGGILRAAGLAEALSTFAEVEVVGFRARDDGSAADDRNSLAFYREVHAVDLGGAAPNLSRVAMSLLQGASLRTSRFGSRRYSRLVVDLVRRRPYDAVHVEELSLMANLDGAVRIPIVYSSHNVEWSLGARLLAARGGPFRFFASIEERRAMREERTTLERAQLCLAVSDEDKRALESLAGAGSCRIEVLPQCVGDDIRPAPATASRSREMLFVAHFGWYPNQQGAEWFLRRIWPLLRRLEEDCEVRFVGAAIRPSLAREIAAGGCRFSADVPEVLPFLHRARVAVVPLLLGGGARIKIVEAWAAGVPVVSTTLGAEGLSCVDGEDILLADDAEAFARAVASLLEDDVLHARLRANGLRRAEERRWSRFGPVLHELYADMLVAAGRAQ